MKPIASWVDGADGLHINRFEDDSGVLIEVLDANSAFPSRVILSNDQWAFIVAQSVAENARRVRVIREAAYEASKEPA